MPARLIHLSDLHAGAREEADVEAPLHALIEHIQPELIVATGDLTHHGRRRQHERAAAFLRSLGPAVLAVPGNHDIPYTFPARFTRPWREFERHWGEVDPVFRSDQLVVVGLNSVRPWRHQSGGLAKAALERAEGLLAEAPPGALRAVCLHHQLANAPWRTRKRPLSRRGHVLRELAAAGVELVLSGHVHQASAGDRREFAVLDDEPTVAVVTAPGLTRPRPRRLGEAQGAQAITVGDEAIAVETYILERHRFAAVAERRLERTRR